MSLLLASLIVAVRSIEAPHPLITPFALHPHGRRDLSETCGYENADILSPLGCSAGSSCAAATTDNVAGGCCRLASSCDLPTRCIESASLDQVCNSVCRTRSLIAKCSDPEAPYCYTRYWASSGETPSEVGCTSTQGLVAYVYTTYTGYGASIAVPTSRSTTVSGGAAEAAATGSDDQTTATATPQQDEDNAPGSPPAGAIAGGVVGGLAILGAAAVLIAWMILRHRRRARTNTTAGTDARSKHTSSGEGDGPQVLEETKLDEATSVQSPNGEQRMFEIGTGQKRHELHAWSHVQELP